MVIYREYEQIIEGLLEEHAASEGFDSAAAFVEGVRATVRPAGQGQGEVRRGQSTCCSCSPPPSSTSSPR